MKVARGGHGAIGRAKPQRAVIGDLVGGLGVMFVLGAIAPRFNGMLWSPWGRSDNSRLLWGMIGLGFIAAAYLIGRVAASLGTRLDQ